MLGLMVALVVAAAPATAAADERPIISGDPLALSFDTSPFDRIDASFNNDGPIGVLSSDNGFELALYGSGTSYELWGFLDRSSVEGDAYFSYHYGSGPVRSGSGMAADPYVYTQGMYAGQDSRLQVTESLIFVNGSARFRVRWEVRNVGSAAVNFRATHMARLHFGTCALGRFSSAGPRSIGAYIPEEGVHGDGNTCSDPDSTERGAGSYLEEVPSSPWSHFQEGRISGISDPNGPGLDDTWSAAPVDASVAAQWDGYGRGHAGLAPGQTALFEVDYRLTNELLTTPWKTAIGQNCPYDLTFSTRYAEGGPRPGRLIQWETQDGRYRRSGALRTDAQGLAHLSYTRDFGYDQTSAYLDRNEDGTHQEADELFRRGIDVGWVPGRPCAATGPQGDPEQQGDPGQRGDPGRQGDPGGQSDPGQRRDPRLALRRPRWLGKRLVLRGSLARSATGSVRVHLTGRRHGRTFNAHRRVGLKAGRFRAALRLGRRLRHSRGALVEVRYGGDTRFAPDSARRRIEMP